MSVSSGVRPVGAVLGVSVLVPASEDPQDALLAELVAFMTRDAWPLPASRRPMAQGVATRICERLREPFLIDGELVHIGGSIGYAMFPEDATSYEALMRRADEAMYEAKRDLKATGGGSRRARR